MNTVTTAASSASVQSNPISFSVVIATYNRRELLLQAIQSVVEQTETPLEIIVVIDGSTDDTADAVRAAYPDIRIVAQPNLGPSIAHNAGVAASRGTWVCFLDDDDIWHRDKLKITRQYLAEHPDCQAVPQSDLVLFVRRDDVIRMPRRAL